MRSATRLSLCIALLSALAMAQSAIPTIEQPLSPPAIPPGSAAFTLTIPGAGFVPAPSTVLWQQGTTVTQLTITAATTTQVTTTVPAANIANPGTAFVSVLNGGLPSNVQFFQIATPVPAQFSAPVNYNPGLNTVQSVVTADFNGDGILDLAVGVTGPVGAGTHQVSVFLGNGDGTFQNPTAYAVTDASSIVAGRFNNKVASIDLVAGDTLLVGAGNGTFTPTSLPTAGFRPFVAADFRQAGVLDLAGLSPSGITILNNSGTGSFTIGQSFTGTVTTPLSIVGADFNGDGFVDLAVLDVSLTPPPQVVVFLGSGTGFSGGNGISTATLAPAVAFTAADFNGDGKQDLAYVYISSGGQLQVLNGNGDGTFTNGFTTALANLLSGPILTGDFNEDGKLDLATGTYILPGNGDGTFQTPANFGGTAAVLATGDFNNDGRPDLAANASPNVAILLQPAPPAPAVSLSPQSLSFGSQIVGTMSASQTITLTNTGNALLSIDAIGITGVNANQFSQTNTCAPSMEAGTNCAITVTFAPTSLGNATASVSIADNAPGSPQTVPLTGAGVSPGTPGAMLSPASLSFSAQPVGITSSPQVVTLTNNGTAPLAIASIAFTGPNAGDFAQTNDCGASLAAAASCAINVTFTPTTVGAATAAISIADNAPGSPQTVPHTGTGAPFALTTTCTSLTVVPGQTAVFTVDLAPVAQLSSTVSLACSGAPAFATCTVSPSSMTLSGSTGIKAQVTATTARHSSALQLPFGFSTGNQMAGMAALTGFGGLAALVFLPGKRRTKPARRVYGLIFWLCIVGALAVLPSCGGSHAPGTATGTYPLTVTGTFQPATGSAITESVSFNLVVQ